jgi:ubiquinone/menaquinone biosynthesis C-methylase UbiE
VAGARSRGSFNCLWCGRPYTPRGGDDLEAYARLCPDCLGRAQDNEFLRFRLREGIKARAAAVRATDPDEQLKDYYAARAAEYDDWYLRRGAHSGGTLADVAFQADLDAATMWLDALPLAGEIVELAAGTGWWSPLLAQKGELWLYDANEEPLERARERLLAHGLRAHIHVRDAWTEPDRQVDAVFCGFWLSHVRRARLGEFLALIRRWLKPGGTFAFIDEAPGPDYTPTVDDRQPRRTADGREFLIPKVYYSPAELDAALREAGFSGIGVMTTSRFFLLGRTVA